MIPGLRSCQNENKTSLLTFQTVEYVLYSLHEQWCLCIVLSAQGGLSGGGARTPLGGARGRIPPREKIFYLGKHVIYLGGFSTHGFCRWFSISG
jgi:hypothetical protein